MNDFNIMIVDDEEAILEGIKDTLTEYPIRTFRSSRAAETALDSSFYDIIVADYKMPDLSGLDFFIRAKQKRAYDYGILLTAYADKELLRTFLNQNLIHKVVEKPLQIDYLRSVLNEGVSHCLRRKQDERELRELQERYESMLKPTWCLNDRLSGADRGLKEVVGKAAQMAATTENVLITGETGTGKEVFARAIHSMGPRKDQPFVKINCGAIPETLIEDELFGHIKGAYSGAYTDKPGRIELAEKGTLFLDEIGELKPELQTRLLQVVQEKRIERIGSTKATPVDFRLLSATNQDIETMLRTRRLREDLYYRIATFHIHIPPLRERKKDIPLLHRLPPGHVPG
jgi:DNA-binding NtrC family response regulator